MAADKVKYWNATFFSPFLILREEKLSGGLLPSSHLRGHIHNNKNVTRAVDGDSARRQHAKWEIVWKIIPWHAVREDTCRTRIVTGLFLCHYSTDLQMPVPYEMPRLCCYSKANYQRKAEKRQYSHMYFVEMKGL